MSNNFLLNVDIIFISVIITNIIIITHSIFASILVINTSYSLMDNDLSIHDLNTDLNLELELAEDVDTDDADTDDADTDDADTDDADTDDADTDDADTDDVGNDITIIPGPDPRSNPQLSPFNDLLIKENDKEDKEIETEDDSSIIEIYEEKWKKEKGVGSFTDNKKDLVILITDNTANNKTMALVKHNFIPQKNLIFQGTKVTWLNIDPKSTHSLIIQERQDPSKLIFSNLSIPFMNSTNFTFNSIGKYIYSNPFYPLINGTINVIHNDE